MKWKLIPGCTYYKVSKRGKVKSIGRWVKIGSNERYIEPRIIKQRTSWCGYQTVKIRKSTGKVWVVVVHRLVLLAFVDPCPKGHQCRHLDGNKQNNYLSNLKWGTPKENAKDKIRYGRHNKGERHGEAKLKDKDIPNIHKQYTEGDSTYEIAKRYGVSSMCIRFVLRGVTYQHCQPKVRAKLRADGFQKGNQLWIKRKVRNGRS